MAERRDLPLFAWGDSLRAARSRRKLLWSRCAVVAVGIVGLGGTIMLPPPPRLVWNVSASAPIGLYVVAPGQQPGRGDMVVAWPPAAARDLAARRGYLAANVPLVKRVAAVEGDTICASGQSVRVNGAPVALRLTADAAGRPLPRWDGCVRLARGMIFLLMARSTGSFDGRYFGPTLASDVIGKASLTWRR
ncbi:S26 family signal peptidase [Allosphingosinicella deserti]|uniref:S26 family signal peptidase n=1 Tax=Allosphingosinicella deserti TaxID=2116704 RepID=A0A2P7QW64_9SPHN|nr:S26 family signal peptidase [Sphingomonas deserti]PSJ42179.1 S26 family signal peptidase [Sphingomonas deserti]